VSEAESEPWLDHWNPESGDAFQPMTLTRVVTLSSVWTFQPSAAHDGSGQYLRLPRQESGPRQVETPRLEDGRWMGYLSVSWIEGDPDDWHLRILPGDRSSARQAGLITGPIVEVRSRATKRRGQPAR
jgi:hypothetical protein